MNRSLSPAANIIADLKPKNPIAVRTLLHEAGVDVSVWNTNKSGELLDNPNANSYRNAFWSFSDDEGHIALCVWHTSLKPEGAFEVEYRGNLQAEAMGLEREITDPKLSSGERISLRTRITKARDFHREVQKAFAKSSPIRIIVLGNDTAKQGKAAHPEYRLLDPSSWHVTAFDGISGNFCIRRGNPPPRVDTEDAEVAVVAADVERIEASTDLSETEKKALVKQRVGQGLFRQRLVERWRTCALTGCSKLLVASHIIPWSRCETAQQRLGASNGLLLAAHLDALFDAGWITFDDKFEMVISPLLSQADCNAYNLSPRRKLRGRYEDLLPSLRWHRDEIFQNG